MRVIRAVGVNARDPAGSRINSCDALVTGNRPDGTIAVDEFIGVSEAGWEGEVVTVTDRTRPPWSINPWRPELWDTYTYQILRGVAAMGPDWSGAGPACQSTCPVAGSMRKKSCALPVTSHVAQS
jgi:hypothetical protein